ncbi:MAG: hypothetical protein HY681_03560 [Chloroflexi bacterium]|nr:hypothetical protein [Chloroflexota bacterium]
MASTEAPPHSGAEESSKALGQLEEVYEARRGASPEALRALYASAATECLKLGISALERLHVQDLESGTMAFITWQERAREDSQITAFKKAVGQFKKLLTPEQKEVLGDFLMNVRLTCIKDPFERWDAIAEEINKVWPKDLDAVEAIRRQRR